MTKLKKLHPYFKNWMKFFEIFPIDCPDNQCFKSLLLYFKTLTCNF